MLKDDRPKLPSELINFGWSDILFRTNAFWEIGGQYYKTFKLPYENDPRENSCNLKTAGNGLSICDGWKTVSDSSIAFIILILTASVTAVKAAG